MDTILSTGSQLAKGVDTILGYVRVTWGNTSLGHGLQQTHLVEHSQNYEGRRDADDASPGHEIRGSRGESRGDEDGTQKNQLTTLFNTDQHTEDGPNVHAEERTRGRNEAALVTTGECDGHNKCIASGYHFAITADGTNTKIIYESTAPEDLQVEVRGKEGQQTFSFTASSEKEIGYETTKPTLPIAVKAEKVGVEEEKENANVITMEEEHEDEQMEEQEEGQKEEQHEEHEEEQQEGEHAPESIVHEAPEVEEKMEDSAAAGKTTAEDEGDISRCSITRSARSECSENRNKDRNIGTHSIFHATPSPRSRATHRFSSFAFGCIILRSCLRELTPPPIQLIHHFRFLGATSDDSNSFPINYASSSPQIRLMNTVLMNRGLQFLAGKR